MRAIGRGAVVACSGALAVAWSPLPSGQWAALPIARHNIPTHRADVRLRDGADLLAMGLGGGLWLIRAGKPCAVAPDAVVRGDTPAALLAAVARAFTRECEALRSEGGRGARGPSERCVRL